MTTSGEEARGSNGLLRITPSRTSVRIERLYEVVPHPTDKSATRSNRCLNACRKRATVGQPIDDRRRSGMSPSDSAGPPSSGPGTLAPVTDFPDGPADETGLTPRQHRVLDVIRDSVERRGYPPSMREIGEQVGLTSTSSVAHQLTTLEKKGYLRRDPNRPRAVEVRIPGEIAGTSTSEPRGSRNEAAPFDETESGNSRPAPAYIPVVGRIAAGGPLLADQVVEDVFPLPRQIVGDGTLFMLHVVGDSMVDAAICDGDWVVVHQQPVAENG